MVLVGLCSGSVCENLRLFMFGIKGVGGDFKNTIKH